MAWVGVVTDAGATLLANYAQSGTILNVSKIKTGTGYVATDAQRRARTSLVTPAGTGFVVSAKSVEGGCQFGMQVGPNDGDSSYLMKEIGLIVDAETGGSSTEVLLAYFNLEEGVSIPTQENFPDFVYVLSATLAIDNTTPFNLTVDPAALVSQATLDAAVAAINASLAEKVAISQGLANARKFLIVDAEGNVSPALVAFEGATGSVAGKAGLAPAPAAGDNAKFLKGDGTWADPPDTTYQGSDNIQISGGIIDLKNSGAIAGNYGMSAPTTGNDGTEINIPYIEVDAKGRIKSISNKVLTLKNTTYTGTSGQISVSGGAIGLATCGTAGTYGPDANVTGNDNATITIPQITVDQYGRVTGITLRTLTCKNSTGYLPLTGGTVTGQTYFSNATASSSTSTGAVKIAGGLGVGGNIYGAKVYGAVWNDYAEFRKGTTSKGGQCMMECPDGWMRPSTKRLQAGCRLTSDTFGSSMGETDEAKTPIAVSGRVLAYPYGDIRDFHIGDAVCSAPGGKVSVMSRREIRRWPDRIVGIVSEIPKDEYWVGGTKEDPKKIRIDGRIWVYVR